MARLLLLLAIFSQALAFSIPSHAGQLTGQELVDYINSKQTLFKAELSKFTKEEMYMRAMKGEFAKFDRGSAVVAEEIEMKDDQIPASFDSRVQWPNCASIHKIWDQSNCGSCWAFSSSEVMSDRTCIATGNQILLSPADVLTCCTACGSGCDGGNPEKALTYWTKTGVVTGGDYGSTGDCKPYQFHPCGTHNGQNYGSCPSSYSTPQCTNQCQQGYTTPYQQDKHYGSSAYYVQRSVAAIQKEIMTYGPVNGCFSLYEDFYQYKSGIYIHTGGNYVGGHCVKTIGWGTENGTPYWIVANSWNSDWGENGYFRIIRGTNEAGFEEYISAGHPKA